MAIDFKLGTPPLITKEKIQLIADAIRRNSPHSVAAWYAKVSERTFYHWMKRGADDNANGVDSIYADFNLEILRVESEKVLEHLDKLDTNKKGWKASLKLLERRWSQFFGVGAYINKELEERAARIEEKFNNLNKVQGIENNG